MIVRLTGVSVAFASRAGMGRRRDPVLAVDDVSLQVRAGQTLGIVGQTGAGKSTIARLVMGMAVPTAGSVEVAGFDLAKVRGEDRRELDRLRQVVLQDPFSSLDPRMRVRDIVAEPLTAEPGVTYRRRRKAIDARVADLMRLVALPPERARAYPHQFSGGQRQRISIARALAPNPRLIVLDEPTSALDVSVRAQILSLLRSLQDQLGLTYLIISHDLMTVAYLAAREPSLVAVMYQGRVVEVGPTLGLFRAPRHPYTLRLLTSIPRPDVNFLQQPRADRLDEAEAPPAKAACRYAGSCLLRAHLGFPERCNTEPPLIEVAPEHRTACHFAGDADILSALGYDGYSKKGAGSDPQDAPGAPPGAAPASAERWDGGSSR